MNIGIIQAHIGSKRLPGKIMLNLHGKEVLFHVYSRCRKAKFLDRIVIATSMQKENDIIENFCHKNGIDCFRGAEENVLERYYQCVEKYGGDYIVRITSDCPLLEPKLIDYWLENLTRDALSFVQEEADLFTGFGLDVFSRDALERMRAKACEQKQKEHVIGYFYDHPEEFSKKVYRLPRNLEYLYRPYRLTLDTREDFEVIQHLYDRFYDQGFVDLEKVIEYLDRDPSILNQNIHVRQKKYETTDCGV